MGSGPGISVKKENISCLVLVWRLHQLCSRRIQKMHKKDGKRVLLSRMLRKDYSN